MKRRPPAVSRRRQREFERAIAAMAGNPEVRAECAAIAADFAAAEMDGLGCLKDKDG